MVGNLERCPFIATALNESIINMYQFLLHVSNHGSILSYEYALAGPLINICSRHCYVHK